MIAVDFWNIAATADPSGGTSPVSFDSPLTWINFGVLGLMVLALLTGWVWAKPAVERILTDHKSLDDKHDRDLARVIAEKNADIARAVLERDKAIEQRDAMGEVLQEKLLPVVGEFVATTRSFLPVLQQLQQLQTTLPKLQELLERLGDNRGPEWRRP